MTSGIMLGWERTAARPGRIGFVVRERAQEERDAPALIEDTGEGHCLVCAGTGNGKGIAFAIPNLLAYPGGVIAVDPKGELFAVTGRHRATLGPVAVIDPFRITHAAPGMFNPMRALDAGSATFVDDLYALADMLAPPISSSAKDGLFWSQSATDVIAGTMAHVATCEGETDRSLGRVYERLTGTDVPYELAVMLDTEKPHPLATSHIGRFINYPDVTRGGIFATLCQHTRMLASAGVRHSFSGNSIDPALIEAGAPFTVYLVMPPDKLISHAALVRLYLTGLTSLLFRRRRKPLHPTLLLVDEAAQIGRVPSLVAATTAGRAYGIRVAWVFQSYGQLRSVYPDESDTIIENCASMLTIGTPAVYGAARQLADIAFGDVSADQVFALSAGEVMARRAGGRTIIGRRLDYRTDGRFAGLYDANPLHLPAVGLSR